MDRTRAYETYVHAIRNAYYTLNLNNKIYSRDLYIPDLLTIQSLGFEGVLDIAVASMRQRLSECSPAATATMLEKPFLRTQFFNGRKVMIPIVNEQGREWYSRMLFYDFDFILENFEGMHEGARTIYDVGGHQGVWALFYATAVGETGRVYTIEPSLLNVECCALSMLLNNIANVIILACGIGSETITVRPDSGGLFIDTIDHSVNLRRFGEVFVEPAQFVKIDIEGFEYDLVTAFPLFDFCRNVHIEVHVPLLERRGLDYRDILSRIPFDRVCVRNWQDQRLVAINAETLLQGYCTLLITPKA